MKPICEGRGIPELSHVFAMLQTSVDAWQKNCLLRNFCAALRGPAGLASVAECWQASLGARSFLLLAPN